MLGRRRHGSQSAGMAERVKPRSREGVRLFRRALRATTDPERMSGGCWESAVKWGMAGWFDGVTRVRAVMMHAESEGSSVTPLWNVLLPVLIGGAIGIVGSFVGPFFLQRLKDAANRKRKRAEKFEELVAAVVEHYHWMASMRFFFVSGRGNQPSLSPTTKIEAIVSTYFPQFEMLVRQLDSASNKYEIWILSTGQKRIANEPGYEKLIGHDDVLTNYTDKRMDFLVELKRFARREFQ
jgi:hypothetical protein